MAVTLDSANSDFHPSDMEFQIVPKYISEAAVKKKGKKKKSNPWSEKMKYKPHCNVSSMFRRNC